ncbi:hypothetical protein GDO81_003256 [Engystomops pustulosus]|uniref:Uncharacterized protein n=1 Tax=Engystomops pustulosus TaxID=76066 RepID=A0AAV7A011_ENGPU|nr:hypothetical protein GDO81_003256 [Engystomops pustulosus]
MSSHTRDDVGSGGHRASSLCGRQCRMMEGEYIGLFFSPITRMRPHQRSMSNLYIKIAGRDVADPNLMARFESSLTMQEEK